MFKIFEWARNKLRDETGSIGINLEGRFIVIPQVVSTIDTTALDSVAQGSHGVLVVIAEGTGLLEPKKIHRIPPSTGFVNRQLVPGSDAVLSLKNAIAPSREVPGAQDLRVIMPNPATQSTQTIQTSVPATLITLTSTGWGTRFNDMTIEVNATAKTVTFTLDTVVETYVYTDNQMITLANTINGRSSLVTASVPGTATGVPATKATAAFTGGTQGSTATQDWQDCFDLVNNQNDIDLEHLASSSTTIQAAWAAGLDVTHRYGFTGGTTHTWTSFSAATTSIASIISEMGTGIGGSSQVVYKGLGADSQASYLSSARYAGMAAGLPPYVPLTNKGLAVSELEADLNDTQITELLQAGIAAPMRRRTRSRTGFTCSRSLTTWTTTDNLFHREYSIGRGVRALEKELMSNLDQYVGQPATPEVITRALSVVDRTLTIATQRDETVRIMSYDRNKISGELVETTLKIYYTFVPIPPINFPFLIGALEPIEMTRTIDLPLGTTG